MINQSHILRYLGRMLSVILVIVYTRLVIGKYM